MSDMVAFLKNENDRFDTIEGTIAAAEDIGVPPLFVDAVKKVSFLSSLLSLFLSSSLSSTPSIPSIPSSQVYTTVAPRITARNALRTAIERVHHSEIIKELAHVLEIRAEFPSFGETEVLLSPLPCSLPAFPTLYHLLSSFHFRSNLNSFLLSLSLSLSLFLSIGA